MGDIQTLEIGKGKPGPGRGAGTPNRATRLLKDAILHAAAIADAKMQERALRATSGNAEAVDLKVKELTGTLEGYLTFLALDHPGSFATLLGRVLPIQIRASATETPAQTAQLTEIGRALAFALRLAAPQMKTIDGVSREMRSTLDTGDLGPE
jgi:hypothetical protein